MSVILDHLTAILVGTSLLGVLLFVQQRGNRSSVENTIHHTIQTQSFSIAETLERDLENIRNAEITGQPANVTMGAGNTTILRFITLEDPTLGDASPLIAVAYRLDDTFQQVLVNDVPQTVYRLGRYVNDGSNVWEFTGGSAETMIGFNASLVSRDMETVVTSGAEPAEFAIVQVAFEAATALPAMMVADQGTRTRSNQTRQGFTFRPPALLVEQTSATPPIGTVPSPWPPLPPNPFPPPPPPPPDPVPDPGPGPGPDPGPPPPPPPAPPPPPPSPPSPPPPPPPPVPPPPPPPPPPFEI